MAGITPEERFQFDLEGYLVVPGVLDGREVARLNELADEVWAGEPDEGGLRRTSRVSQWGPDFRDLIDHPRILPYLVEWLGPKFRIDHDYCIFMSPGTSRGSLHGGPAPQSGEGDHWYRYYPDGTIRNGLTVFTYNLSDCNPGDGGFACIPGSHKTNLRSSVPREVMRFERPAHYVRQPPAKAGDVLIFTEALIHGTLPWTASPRTPGPALQVQPRPLCLERHLVRSRRLPGSDGATDPHHGPTLRGTAARLGAGLRGFPDGIADPRDTDPERRYKMLCRDGTVKRKPGVGPRDHAGLSFPIG